MLCRLREHLHNPGHRWIAFRLFAKNGTKNAPTGRLVQLAVTGLDRAMEMNNGKSKPNWSKTITEGEQLDCILRAARQGALDKSLAGHLKDSTHTAVEVLRRLTHPLHAVNFFVWAAKQNGFKHNLASCNQFLQTLVRCGCSYDAYTIFKQRLSRIIKPDACSYQVLIQGLCEVGKMDAACEIFNEMVSRNLQPGALLCNSLLNGLVSSGRLGDTLTYYEITKEMKQVDSNTYNLMIDAFTRHERMEDGMKVVQEMLKQGFVPEPLYLRAFLELLCVKSRVLDAKSLLHEIWGSHSGRWDEKCHYKLLASAMHTLVIERLCESNKLEDAVDVFESMSKRDLVTYSVVMEGLVRASRFNEVYVLMDRMVEEGCVPDVETFHRLLDEHSQVKNMKRVRRKPSVGMYTLLLHGLCRTGKIEDALGLYTHMLSGSCVPDFVTYTVMIDGLGRAGKGEEAEKVFNDMVDRGCKPQAVTYNALVYGLCSSGCVDRAIGIVKEMPEKGLRTHELVVGGLCMLNRLEDAKRYLEAVTPEEVEAVLSSLSQRDAQTLGRLMNDSLNL